MTKSGTGTWDGDMGQGDLGTWERGDVGTWGRGDAGMRDWGLGDVGTRGRGTPGRRNLKTRLDARGLKDVINKQHHSTWKMLR